MYLVTADGHYAAIYEYDPYGKVLGAGGTIAQINPLRYRGYYYDSETGFYYLQNRYYDPGICRFINADDSDYLSVSESTSNINLFTYCHNNPTNEVDVSGNFGLFALGVIGAVAGGVINYAGQVLSNYTQGKTGSEAWTNVNWGSVASSAFSGAISAIPGSGVLGEVVDVVGSNIIEHGVNALVSGESLNLEDIKKDIASDALTSFLLPDIIPSQKVPRFIRDIKKDARALGIKGTRKLEKFLGFSQVTTIVINTFNADTSSRILDYVRG